MDILTFLNKKALNLAIHKKYVHGDLLLYRDARRFIYVTEAILIVALLAAAFLSKITPPYVINALPIIVLAAGVVWYLFVKLVLHGAILLDRGRRRIAVFKDLKFQTPNWVYPIDNIKQITLRRYRGVRRHRTPPSVYVTLHLKAELENNGKEIAWSLSESEANSVARILARFAKVPAFDWDGDQIWPVVEEENENEEETDEEGDEKDDRDENDR